MHWVVIAAEKHRNFLKHIPNRITSKSNREHLTYMLDKIRQGMSDTKACRWLGWVQACLYMHSVCSLDELKSINLQAQEQNNES